MRPRFAADYRTMVWMLLFAPLVMACQFIWPQLAGGYLTIVGMYLGVSAAVIAHNHNHCPTFKSRGANARFSNVLTVFYGYPTFAWVPTHNLNHHKLLNKEGDATITWRFTNRHNALVAATYFFVSAYYQRIPTGEFLVKTKATNPKLAATFRNQFICWGVVNAALFSLALGLHGVRMGLKVWLFAVLIPAVFALWTVHLFNYEQHVHTDPWSEFNHSRNFVGGLLNFLLFNNGYHTAHHDNAGVHWSELPALHAKIANRIDPALLQRSVWWYWFKQYVLAAVFPSLGTKQIGRAPFDPPQIQSQVPLSA